ncbi:MAG TPA: hypothetical protein VFY90_12255 [Tepidiformaceae bacterium]|nr:hypothetical protein [Tepidiformaceae bacterium]
MDKDGRTQDTGSEPHGRVPGIPGRGLWALLSTAGLMALVAAAVFGMSASAEADKGKKPTPTPTPAVATSTPTSTPSTPFVLTTTATGTPTPAQTPPPPPELRTLPLGPLPSERAVVHTGDGDCLNVRPVPSKKFESDPRFCLNEGEIVYLYGDPVDADGETWRYALGRGWLATRYVRREAAAQPDLLDGFAGVMLSTTRSKPDNDNVVDYVVLERDGELRSLGSVSFRYWGIGGGQPIISPDGRYVAHSDYRDGGGRRLIVEHLDSGSAYVLPGMREGSWGPTGKLLVYPSDCYEDCSWFFGILDTSTGEVASFTLPGEKRGSAEWLPDGSGLLAVADCTRLFRVGLDGDATFLGQSSEEAGACLGGLSLSPDGKYGVAGGIYSPLWIVEPETGAVREFERARRIVEPAGKCGGSIGRLVDILNGERIVYHESLAAKGSNGITIGDLRTGERRVLSFWNIADLRTIGPDRVTFTSFEQMDDLGFQLTWLLDTRTGEARPIAVGTGAGWLR